jgi:hypothetical protein
MLLKVTIEATQAPDRVIDDLCRLLKALLRQFGFRCVEVAPVPFTSKGKAQAIEEIP